MAYPKEVRDLADGMFAIGETPSAVERVLKNQGYKIGNTTLREWRDEYEKSVSESVQKAMKREEIKKSFEEEQIQRLNDICLGFEKLIAEKISRLQEQGTDGVKATELTTAFGTMMDKKRLVENKPTTVVSGEVKVSKWEDL